MPKFKVGFYYDVGGYTEIEANSEREARDKLVEHLCEIGIEDLEYKQTNREYDVFDVEEIK